MADKLHLCLGRRDDINIKSLAKIFFPQKIARAEVRNAEGFENSYACLLALAKRSDCKAVAACLCGAVIWKSFEFIAEPNLIGTKTIRVQAK